MMQLSRLQLRSSRKRRIAVISGVVLLIAIVGAYTLWSKQVWGQYTPMYTQRYRDIQSDIKKTAVLPVTSPKEQDAVLAHYKNISSRVTTEQETLCTVNGWVEWQQRLNSTYRDAQISCQKTTADIAAFQKQLDSSIAFIENDQALAKIISTVALTGELADGAWEGQVNLWSDAIAATTKLSVGEEFKPTQQRAVEKMSAVKQAWVELITAHQQKDKTKYLATRTALASTIDALSEIPIQSQRSFAELARELERVSQKLFVQ